LVTERGNEMQMTKTLKRIGTRFVCDIAESIAFFSVWILWGLLLRPGIAIVNIAVELLCVIRDFIVFPFEFTDGMRKADDGYGD